MENRLPIVAFGEFEMEIIGRCGELPPDLARDAMERSGLSFDDIERINDHCEYHVWGSASDRRYRASAVTKAVKKVAANPMFYAKEVVG